MASYLGELARRRSAGTETSFLLPSLRPTPPPTPSRCVAAAALIRNPRLKGSRVVRLTPPPQNNATTRLPSSILTAVPTTSNYHQPKTPK